MVIEVTKPAGGLRPGKPITLQISAADQERLFPAARKVADIVRANPLARDVDDGLPLPGIDWNLEVNKAEAAKFGASPRRRHRRPARDQRRQGLGIPPDHHRQVGRHPLRFPPERRSLNELDQLVS